MNKVRNNILKCHCLWAETRDEVNTEPVEEAQLPDMTLEPQIFCVCPNPLRLLTSQRNRHTQVALVPTST